MSLLDGDDEGRQQQGPFRLAFDPFDPFAFSNSTMADLTGRSDYVWVACGDGHYVLSADHKASFENGGTITLKPKGRTCDVLFRSWKPFSERVLLNEGLTFEQALMTGDAYALKTFGFYACQVHLAKQARWRAEFPTLSQIRTLRTLLGDELGARLKPSKLTKGDCSSAITALLNGGKGRLTRRMQRATSAQTKLERLEDGEERERQRLVPMLKLK